MPSWPAYAKIERDSFSERRQTALIRSEMEVGPPKQARIKSRVMVERQVVVNLDTLADYTNFISWFKNDLQDGALWFDWTDPVDSVLKQGRIVGGQLGEASPRGAMKYWRLPLTLETWSA